MAQVKHVYLEKIFILFREIIQSPYCIIHVGKVLRFWKIGTSKLEFGKALYQIKEVISVYLNNLDISFLIFRRPPQG
jgi:hypothetical protein